VACEHLRGAAPRSKCRAAAPLRDSALNVAGLPWRHRRWSMMRNALGALAYIVGGLIIGLVLGGIAGGVVFAILGAIVAGVLTYRREHRLRA